LNCPMIVWLTVKNIAGQFFFYFFTFLGIFYLIGFTYKDWDNMYLILRAATRLNKSE